MIKVLGENYFIDLDQIEEFIDMSDELTVDPVSGTTEMKINIIKYELIKTMLDVIFSETEEMDDKLGMKGTSNLSIPFRLAFNSLLNKKLINHY